MNQRPFPEEIMQMLVQQDPQAPTGREIEHRLHEYFRMWPQLKDLYHTDPLTMEMLKRCAFSRTHPNDMMMSLVNMNMDYRKRLFNDAVRRAQLSPSPVILFHPAKPTENTLSNESA